MLIFNKQYDKFLKQADNYKNDCNVIPPGIATYITDINFESWLLSLTKVYSI